MAEAPFPYFGGKSAVAHDVWAALGNPSHYIDPFFGSGAVLLSRKSWDSTTETVNDKDGFVANVWRSLQFSPDETARWCDWPVNHADLAARKKKLIANEERLLENLIADDTWHDPIMAGYWIWAASCWIGSGLTSIGQRPHVGNTGRGVHKIGKRPHLSGAGMGVQCPYNSNIYSWFRELSERLRNVRVVCGDWTRVCGGDWQDNIGICGIFFDPPYGVKADRTSKIYHKDCLYVADQVRLWCKDRGSRHSYRIVLAGYYEEHVELLDHGWRVQKWTAQGGYAHTVQSQNSKAKGRENMHREALFYSPHCLDSQNDLFAAHRADGDGD